MLSTLWRAWREESWNEVYCEARHPGIWYSPAPGQAFAEIYAALLPKDRYRTKFFYPRLVRLHRSCTRLGQFLGVMRLFIGTGQSLCGALRGPNNVIIASRSRTHCLKTGIGSSNDGWESNDGPSKTLATKHPAQNHG